MEKDIPTKVFQVLDWFRGTAHARESIKMLIELLGLKYLEQESETGEAVWKKLRTDHLPDESTLQEVRVLLSNKGWEAGSLLLMLKSSRNIDLVGQLFAFADRLDFNRDGYDIAWALINLYDKQKQYDTLSYPVEGARLMTKLLHIEPAASNSLSVLCAGTGNLGIAMESRKLGARVHLEIPPSAVHAAILFSISGNNGECAFIPLNEPVSSSGYGHYNLGVIVPPWGDRIGREIQQKWSYSHYHIQPTGSESFYIQEALERIQDRFIVMTTPGFLFRTAGTDLELKRYLVKDGLIEAIIQLPEKLLPHTMVAPAMTIINKTHRHENVMFVDASADLFVAHQTKTENTLQHLEKIQSLVDSRRDSEYSRIVTMAELDGNDFNLSVRRYVLTSEARNIQTVLSDEITVALDEVATIVRAQAIGSREAEIIVDAHEVNPADIHETGYIGYPSKTVSINAEKINRYDRQKLKPGDILLAIKGSIGRVGIVPDDAGKDWYAGQSFAILRLIPDSPIKDPIVLYRYLASDFAQQLLLSRSAGATVKLIKMQDVNKMQVIIPSMERQQEILENNHQIIELYRQIDSARQQIKALRGEYWALDSSE